jgi:hypothetical protein
VPLTGESTDRAFLDKINMLAKTSFLQQQFSFSDGKGSDMFSQIKRNAGTDGLQKSEYSKQGGNVRRVFLLLT